MNGIGGGGFSTLAAAQPTASMAVHCPKCGGGTYLVDEELLKVLENTDPIKLILRAIYLCRSCGEKFSRVVYDDLTARKKPMASGQGQPSPYPAPVQGTYESGPQPTDTGSDIDNVSMDNVQFF